MHACMYVCMYVRHLYAAQFMMGMGGGSAWSMVKVGESTQIPVYSLVPKQAVTRGL